MVEIMWHRREIRRQTEKTNINLNIGRNRSTRLKPNNLLGGGGAADLLSLFKQGSRQAGGD
ncbi:MAG: hypothetical protein PHI84_22485 [Kiritimatiellae bacterium]|nr:hypothetical protein [Kiritimatiellia bacterium]